MTAPATAFDDSLDQFLEKHPGQTEEEYLDAWEERWNKRIDKEVVILGEGFGKMMDAFEVCWRRSEKSMFGLTQKPQRGLMPKAHVTETAHLSADLLSSTILNSATSLLSLTHQLKLMVILSDTKTIEFNQAKERKELEAQVESLKQGVRTAVKSIADNEQS